MQCIVLCAGPEEEAVMTEMRRLVNKVDEMKTQRNKLENQLREDLKKDDITTVIMASDTTKDVIFVFRPLW